MDPHVTLDVNQLEVAPCIASVVFHALLMVDVDALLIKQVVASGADYLLIAKEKQPTPLSDIVQVFTSLTVQELAGTGIQTVQPLPMQTYRTIEKGHGRQEERQIRVSSELAGYSSWLYLAQMFAYTRSWTAKGVTNQQVRYGISSLAEHVSDAARLAILKRGYWQVENGLHYVKDVTLGEDACQTYVATGQMGWRWCAPSPSACSDVQAIAQLPPG